MLSRIHDFFLSDGLDDVDLHCACGNPECKSNLQARRGYVSITHEDGSTEERDGWLWLDAFGDYDDKTGELEWVQMGLEPHQARELMWQLIRDFMPGVHQLVSWWPRHVNRRYWMIRLEIEEWLGL